jgi:hypothetical protein
MRGMRTLLRRIERAEVMLKAQSILSPDCICFPEKEQPFFGFDYEAEIAFRVKCPLHGDRFQPRVHLFIAGWRREREKIRRATLGAQFHKAWEASFPSHLFPAEEETTKEGIYLRLRDGTRVLVEKFKYSSREPARCW